MIGSDRKLQGSSGRVQSSYVVTHGHTEAGRRGGGASRMPLWPTSRVVALCGRFPRFGEIACMLVVTYDRSKALYVRFMICP